MHLFLISNNLYLFVLIKISIPKLGLIKMEYYSYKAV